MAKGARNAFERAKPIPAFGIAEMIVAIDEPAPARQAAERAFQNFVIARVGDQPDLGKKR